MIDRDFRRQQLNDLRAAIGRIPPFKTKRQSFTQKQRQAVSGQITEDLAADKRQVPAPAVPAA